MASETVHPLFPYTKADVQEIRKELGLKESTIEEDVDAIVDWFQKQPHLVEAGIDRDYVERMLIVTKGSMEKAKRKIDSFYKYRLLAPEIIQNRDKTLSDCEDLWSVYLQVSMPKLYNGNRISVVQFMDADKFSCEAFMRSSFMLADIRLKYDYFLSDIWIIDMKNTTFAQLLRLNPVIMQKAAHLLHDGLGLRINSIHILNGTTLIHHFINFLTQFFSQKLLNRVIVHESLDSLHMSLPKKLLPKDYGGEEPSLAEFKDKYEKEVRSTNTKQFLIDSMKMVSNEKRRPGFNINEEFLEGSFRKLEFD